MRDGHATREAILSVIAETPGIHKRAICQELDLGWGTVSHHVQVLMRAKRLKEWRGDRLVHYFPAVVPEANIPWLLALRDADARTIVGHLENRPWRGVAGLSNDLGIGRKAVRRHLTTLSESGMLEEDGSYHPRFRLQEAQRGILERLGLRRSDPGTPRN
ncbi:MAG: winged helix-turn-helix transcriptional regulator [Thermoplasmatota archaeon]